MKDEKILDLFSLGYSRSQFSIKKFTETNSHGGLSNFKKRIAKTARTIKPTGGANWQSHYN
jgi:hypothetical protein|tara:strand:- start:1397 stop:1579 length:183 start_codon:yes stop_codon:yes gene_type:complete